MPLRTWIILNLDSLGAVGDGGVTVGGEAACRIAKTNHLGHGGGVASGSATVNQVFNAKGTGGGVAGGSAIVSFVHVEPPKPQTHFKKIRWMPGDIVWDSYNTKYVVEELFAGVGENRYVVNHAGNKFVLYENQLEDFPFYPSLVDCDYNFQKKIQQLRDGPVTSRSYPGVRRQQDVIPASEPVGCDYNFQKKIQQLRDGPVTSRSYPGVRKVKVEV